jgi:hypothetical protein
MPEIFMCLNPNVIFIKKSVISYFLTDRGKQFAERSTQTAVKSEHFLLKYVEHQRTLNFIHITRLTDFRYLPNKKVTYLVMHTLPLNILNALHE